MHESHRFDRSDGAPGAPVSKVHCGGKQHFAGPCTPAQLGGNMRGIAHQGERRMLGRAESSNGNFSAVDAEADAGNDRMFLSPR